ncbi:hypothetical protein [Bartonella raoultii]|uniref:hypothetical protein n=1 Tax=Bartonella raoultii TaxID=1457020 RepID=UPI001ABA4B7E|nr:hypothetical protein [Bartonella raoultii]
MTTDQQQNKQQHEFFQTQGNTQTSSQATFAKGSKLFAFREAMMLSIKDYKIIFCIAIVLLILGALRAVYLPVFFFGLFVGGIYTGDGGFIDFLVFLPALLWGLSVIFLPIVLVLHYILNRRLKEMLQKLEKKSSVQKDKSDIAQTK